MGTDVYVLLGRINTRAIEARSGKSELVLFGNKPVHLDDFEFTELPENLDVTRNYALFAFLADVRGSVRPLLDKERLEAVMAGTHTFLKWIDSQLLLKHRAERLAQGLKGDGTYAPELEDKHYIGDFSRVVHLTSMLAAFDYDQIAEIEDDNAMGEAIYLKEIGGLTYREHFPKDYFEVLDYCMTNNWNFIIFGFD